MSRRAGYRFLDCGEGRRLEDLGGVVVSRPAPAAAHGRGLGEDVWRAAALSFERGGGWRGAAPAEWTVDMAGVRMALRPAAGGQVGVFPEHAAVAERLAGMVAAGSRDGGTRILNLFAHTGLATLRLAGLRGVEVTHVDAAAAAVRTARENLALSGLSEATVRWLVDDAMTFMGRETRRKKSYRMIVADPPSFGRGGGGRREWRFGRDLPGLLETAARLFAPGPGVFCLTCHSEGWSRGEMAATVKDAFPGWNVESDELSLRSSTGGRSLSSGMAVYAVREG